jgi:hypothetical protein
LQVSYGKVDPSSIPVVKGLSLPQLAALPDSVRMRILLFLKDLSPLERALQVKKESNSFLRCRAVNKGIIKMSKKVTKSNKSSSRRTPTQKKEPSTTRRQELMTEILKLDGNELEEMWASHNKNLRKHAKKRTGVDRVS